MFRGTYKLGNFYFNYCIEANQVNLPPFLRLKLRTPDVHRSVPPNVHLGTVNILIIRNKKRDCQNSVVIIWRMLARSLHTSPREKQLCSFWVFEITPMASELKKPESKWCLQHLLCWYTNTPVWINAWVQAVCEMPAKGILLLPSRLQITQYLWLLGVVGISSGIDFGLTACPLLWNCSLGVLDTLPIHTSLSVQLRTAWIAYNITIAHIPTHRFFHMMPELRTWRNMTSRVLTASFWAKTTMLLLRHRKKNTNGYCSSCFKLFVLVK